MTSAVSPLFASPVARSRSIASGIEAADVLPVVRTSRATVTCSGSLSVFTIESMMRSLAWWGMKTSRSSGESPEASSASLATFAISNTAQRNTAWPSCVIAGNLPELSYSFHGTVCLMVSDLSPSDPHTVGPMCGSWEGPTTTAPAPSPNRKAVARSSRSVRSDNRSTPMTRTYSAEPSTIMPLARVRP